jgi:hypothetical protein
LTRDHRLADINASLCNFAADPESVAMLDPRPHFAWQDQAVFGAGGLYLHDTNRARARGFGLGGLRRRQLSRTDHQQRGRKGCNQQGWEAWHGGG